MDFYRDADERVPSDVPPPQGCAILTHCFVDSNDAGDKVTRRSQTGLLLFVNRAPVVWYSKRQNMVERSTFGSEFITMKTAVKQIEALWYKLRMFGIPIEGSMNIFCDNKAVFKNTTMPDSTLKKAYQHMLSLVQRSSSIQDHLGGQRGDAHQLERSFHQASPTSHKGGTS